jgi:hypothetical protein
MRLDTWFRRTGPCSARRYTSRSLRSLGIWLTFLSHSLGRLVRQASSAPRESIEVELRRVEGEFEDARSLRHARRPVAEAMGTD